VCRAGSGSHQLEYGLVFGTRANPWAGPPAAIRAAARPFATGLEDVYLDARMSRSILEPGYGAILPPAQFTLKSRLVAPPMGPLEVVTALLPHIAAGPAGAIQNLLILTGDSLRI